MIQEVELKPVKPLRLPFYKHEDMINEVYRGYQYYNLSPSEQDIFSTADISNYELRIRYKHFLLLNQRGLKKKDKNKGTVNYLLRRVDRLKLTQEIERLK